MFTGGRGGNSITRAIAKYPLFELTNIINAYDDGLSTGVLRNHIPGFLGPSDVRKNLVALLDHDRADHRALEKLLEYRFDFSKSNSQIITQLNNILSGDSEPPLSSFTAAIHENQQREFRQFLNTFLIYFQAHRAFPLQDMSMGNILMTGCFLEVGDFNLMVQQFSQVCGISHRILNVSQGENFWLVGLKSDGEILVSEADLVREKLNLSLTDIFLLATPLSDTQLQELNILSHNGRQDYLLNLHQQPQLNTVLPQVLLDADFIIYAPGTQFSSLYPTYLTEGLGKLISFNRKAIKLLISNIGEDCETPNLSANDLIEKTLYYLNNRAELNDPAELITDVFVNKPETDFYGETRYLPYVPTPYPFQIHLRNWEGQRPGTHHGEHVVNAMLNLKYEEVVALNSNIRKLSVVIPAYNEAPYIAEVIRKVQAVDLAPMNVIKEIIVVDDGSRDNTFEIANSIPGVKAFKQTVNQGKGAAVKRGIEIASGDMIIIQDADLEYDPDDYKKMLPSLLDGSFKAVYGSRTMKKESVHRHLAVLHGKHPAQYWAHYLAGVVLSQITFFLFGRYLTDTLTAYKLYDAPLLKSLKLRGKGFELDHEITAKVIRRKIDILEVPISYTPRTKSEGKKISAKDGFIAVATLMRFRFTS